MRHFGKLLAALLIAAFFGGCAQPAAEGNFKRGLNDYAFTAASLSAVDRENRTIAPMYAEKTDKVRYVGVFYWLWMGNNDHQFGVYDVTKLLSTPEGEQALFQTVNPPGDGMENASPLDYMHWTNEPMLGYYNSSDPWVIARHIEMLTLADVDFIFFDATNYYTYAVNHSQQPEGGKIKGAGMAVLDTLLEYYDQGWDVPKVAFYTNSCSGDRVQEIFDAYYRSGKYEDLWFKPEGKPLIIGTTENNGGGSDMDPDDPSKYNNISPALQEYFDVKESQWPTREAQPQGFPWMSWDYPQKFHEESRAINVSVSQHSKTHVLFSLRHKWSSKGYDYHTDTIEENWAAGRNFENEWETVFTYEAEGKEIEFVTVTGWNEWVGQKTRADSDAYCDNGRNPTRFMMVDNFSAEYSRDIEPDKTYYKDNVYMQLVRNVRRLKYDGLEAGAAIEWGGKTIGKNSDFDSGTAVYRDFVGDARRRDFCGYDIRTASLNQNLVGAWYRDDTNRNDITEVRVTADGQNVYFRIETAEDVIPYVSGDNWMNILIQTGDGDVNTGFEGYDYIVNRAPDGDKTTVERRAGGWNWEKTGEAEISVSGKYLTVTVPLSALGLSSDNVKFSFKVADNVQKPGWYEADDPDHEVLHYYITGDSAPIGRLNSTYGY